MKYVWPYRAVQSLFLQLFVSRGKTNAAATSLDWNEERCITTRRSSFLLYFKKSIKWTHDLMHRLSCYRYTWLVAHNVYSALIYIMALSFHLLASKQFVNYLLLPIVAAFLLLHQGAYSWPSGAPTLACGTMTPGHFRFSQTTACHFTTSTNAVQIS